MRSDRLKGRRESHGAFAEAMNPHETQTWGLRLEEVLEEPRVGRVRYL